MVDNNPEIGSLAWMEQMNNLEKDTEASKVARKAKLKIDEKLSLGETMSEERARQRSHPAGHIRSGAPVGTSTVGQSSRGEIPGGSRE